ncbi:MAG: hypothetical protein IKB80_06395 [Oscillospiraceae bacterium]|nr:hypothetical protein [Oscillospiraceae bacterium]
MAMFEAALTDVIAIDAATDTVHFYTAPGSGRKDNHFTAGCNCQTFGEEFIEKFGKVLKAYRQKNPAAAMSKVSLVLPDYLFLTDTIDIPAVGKKAMESSLEVAIGAVYKNKNDLKYHTFPLAQNKQFATFGLVGMRKDLALGLTNICAANQISVQNITFAANAMVNGAMILNPKLKTGTFVLLNIQENNARVAFVNKGRTVGMYDLPFGHAMLYKTRLAAEDLLFDHATGQLLVLNAKEKAKAKQLTMMGEEVLADPDEGRKDIPAEGQEDGEFEAGESKKGGRKLPKFMQRETPTDREGFQYENFRIFMKWTLELIASNPSVTALGEIDGIYVNMPRDYMFLFGMANAEEEENGVKFLPMMAAAGFDSNAAAARDLELFGGLYVKQFNKINNF